MARKVVAILVLMVGRVGALFASSGGTGLPWEGTLDTIQQSFTGPIPIAIGTIMIVVAGIVLMVTDGAGWKKLFWVVIGIGIALNVTPLMNTLGLTSAGGFLL